MSFINDYLNETNTIISQINKDDIQELVYGLAGIKDKGGRLFILGVGGSAGTSSHAVNDFRKICGIESYTPTDNASELTARINDEGFENCFSSWLEGSRFNSKDAILIFSVGGGNVEKNISMNLVSAIDYAKEVKAKVFGIIGRDGGYTKTNADACVIIPTVSTDRITPHTEGIAGIILHLLVSHPLLKINDTKWESTAK